jgi:hypothetical protein
MAKLNYKLYVPEYIGHFEGDFDLTVKKNGKEATWEIDNEELNTKIEITGEKLVAYNGFEKVILDVSDLKLNAAKLSEVFLEQGLFAAVNLITNGNDTVVGTKKSDYLFSGAGDDELTGKGGNDTFEFQKLEPMESAKKGAEHDVITDFAVKGEGMDYLEFSGEIESVDKLNKNKDCEITFDDGSTLVLEGVTKKQFTAYWEGMMEM